MNALSVEKVTVRVKDVTLLDSVSLDVASGEWVSIIGPNGAGKSTLLRAIAGVIEYGGRITAAGIDLQAVPVRERARMISWVPQSPTVPAGMKVLDYVLLGRTPHLSALAAPKNTDVEIAMDRLGQLDLIDFANRYVDTLSGGELQRVAIGRALVQDSPVMLLDEPTSALDLGHQQDVLMLLDDLRANGDRTIISTMHDLTLAGHFADRISLLAKGSVAAVGPASTVLTEANIAQHYNARVAIRHVRDTVVISPQIATPSSFELPPHFQQRIQDNHVQDSQEKSTITMSENSTEPLTENPAKEKTSVAKSIILVNTGDGKGKSSAAFGVMLRGLARDWPVAVVQYIKSGDWNVGEEKMGRKLGVDWFTYGDGFTWNSEDLENDKAIAQRGWDQTAALIAADTHRLIILDELTYLINWGWIEAEPVYEAIRNRPEKVNIVVTGRDAPDGLIEVADTVSEVVKVKHAFDRGIIAKKGIDY